MCKWKIKRESEEEINKQKIEINRKSKEKTLKKGPIQRMGT